MSSPDAAPPRRIVRLVGVYDADSTVRGELAYRVSARLGRRHCSLCEITHGSVRQRPEWKACPAGLPVPFDTYHRNDQPDPIRRRRRRTATGGGRRDRQRPHAAPRRRRSRGLRWFDRSTRRGDRARGKPGRSALGGPMSARRAIARLVGLWRRGRRRERRRRVHPPGMPILLHAPRLACGELVLHSGRSTSGRTREAAAVVRSVANGNETVPTVTVGDVSMVNPSARHVRAIARSHDVPEPTRRRWLRRGARTGEPT